MPIKWGEFKRIVNEMHWSDDSFVESVQVDLRREGPPEVIYSKTMGDERQPHQLKIRVLASRGFLCPNCRSNMDHEAATRALVCPKCDMRISERVLSKNGAVELLDVIQGPGR
jgi:DNA-directed RNA polymerase subunit RPC12/RpoP